VIFMAETKQKEPAKGDKVFTIPLRKAFGKSMRIRARVAASLVKKFLKMHMKADEAKLGYILNEKIWERGMKKPPRRVKVVARKEEIAGKIVVKAELFGHEYKDFKMKPRSEKKGMKEKLMERMGPKAIQKEEEEKMSEGKKELEKPLHVDAVKSEK
jgi:large subunit ribosomal protein L31e